MAVTGRGRCPLCGAAGGRAVWQGEGRGGVRRILRCDVCGAGYCDPMPSPSTLAGWYGESYFEACYGGDREPSVARQGEWLETLARRRPAAAGNLLDVGCGVGDLAVAAARQGWSVTGLEASPAAVSRARQRGVEVLQGDAADLLSGARAAGPFDVVVFRDSLAHMTGAGAALAGAARRLAAGGWLAVRVPNRHRAVLRAARWAALLGDASGILHLPAQLLHLDRAALTAALGRLGLARVEVTGESEQVQATAGRYSRRLLPDRAWRLLVRRWQRRGEPEALWGWGQRS